MTVESNRHLDEETPHDRTAEAIAFAVHRHRSIDACVAEKAPLWLAYARSAAQMSSDTEARLPSRRLLDEVTTQTVFSLVASHPKA